MSTLAYGWVERCSDVAVHGILHQKISTAIISSLQLTYYFMNHDEHVNAVLCMCLLPLYDRRLMH